MTDKEATDLWNSPRCPRCTALEDRLRTCLKANESLKKGLDKAYEELDAAVLENKRLTSALALQASLSKWGKA